MNRVDQRPSAPGQLVWSPADPTMGVGLVIDVEGPRVRVRFHRLNEERVYTTRRSDCVLVRYEIEAGERVRDHQGQELRVVSALGENPDQVRRYSLEDGSECAETLLVPDIRDMGAKERLATLNLAHPEVVRSRVHGLELAHWGSRAGTAAILGSRVQWLPHQVDVATRAISSDPVRLLLADEVGLGKTVEAALIYAGLRAEGRANRVLILTPDALCIQWLGEIFRKSHELLVLLDDDRIKEAEEVHEDLSPFEANQRIIASTSRVASSRRLTAQAAATDWDLVVVDEAHHLRWSQEGGGNPAYKLVERLAAKTRHLLLLTATPMALDPAEYHALLRLLDPERFDDPARFGVVRERVGAICAAARQIDDAVARREPLSADVLALTRKLFADAPEDIASLDALAELEPGAAERASAGEEVLELLRDRHGLTDYVIRNRRGPVGGMPQRNAHTVGLVPTELQDILLDVGESVVFELAESIADDAERYDKMGRMLRAMWATPGALLEIAKSISPVLVQQLAPHIESVVSAPPDADGLPTGDARLRWLVELIRRSEGEKLLVFVESAIAVRALKAALDVFVGDKVAVFHRELAPRDQDRQVAWFRDPDGPQVMLSTEAGGEGRNFQFCHHVILYDLPWRPATIEQRIGRVDRVGQIHDVEVYVPFFKSGYEAAILKVMQQSIGVLDRTVGGIDHALEYVSGRLAELVYTGAEAEDWMALYEDTESMVRDYTDRIEASADPILDHASFDPDRASAVLDSVPEDLEEQTENFVRGYADHSRLALHTKDSKILAVEGAPGSAGDHNQSGYVATFDRMYALDHEGVEFLSFGHPLVEQALEWARDAQDASAALAICRGFPRDGAIFVWRYGVDVPDDAPEIKTYFGGRAFSVALDESGKRAPQFDTILEDDTRPLDRMDASPLKGSIERWRMLVERNCDVAQGLADDALEDEIKLARTRLVQAYERRARYLERQALRETSHLKACQVSDQELRDAQARHEVARDALELEHDKMMRALGNVRPRLQAAVAVRLVKASRVSG